MQEFLSDKLAKALVKCVEDAVGDEIKEDIIRSKIRVTNSIHSRTWDYIYTSVLNQLENEECVVVVSNSGPWEMAIIYDSTTGNVITLMREQRFRTLQRNQRKRSKLHYLDCFARALNEQLRAENEQLSLLEEQPSDLEKARQRVSQLLNDLAGKADVVNHHVLVLFDTYGYQLVSARAIMVTPNLDIAKGSEINLSRFITARESVIAETVSAVDSAANNPGRSLKLSKKALERKKKLGRINNHSENTSSQ